MNEYTQKNIKCQNPCGGYGQTYTKDMHEKLLKDVFNHISPQGEDKPLSKKISSGVFMTVWQKQPVTPEMQLLIQQQQEIEVLKQRTLDHDQRIALIENKVAKLELSYKSILRTLDLIDAIE